MAIGRLFAAALITLDSGSAQPNILMIVSEDNGPEIGVYGDPYSRTPVLDELANSGVRFDRAYVAQAGCSPSRASFLTGLYPHQNGQIGLATWKYRMYREDTPNMVTLLKSAGYRTGLIGKLHVNPESAFPFDFSAIGKANFARKELGDYASKAGEFFRASDGPFFLSINYPDAHRPFLRQVEGLPADPLGPEDAKPPAYLGFDSDVMQAHSANYYNSMERLDSVIGVLLEELDRSGKTANTLVVYFGDHGADMFRGKRTSYEGGVRIPLIVRWPGRMKAGQVLDDLVSTIDLLPTFLDAAEATLPAHLPGRSLVPLLAGEQPEWRQRLFTEFHVHSNHNYYPQRAVRDERYKLIWNLMPDKTNPGAVFTETRYFKPGEFDIVLQEAPAHVRQAYELMRRPPEFELYDLIEDPHEFHNLAGDAARASDLERLRQALLQWRRETKDPFLDPENVAKLKAEVEKTFYNDTYNRPEGWEYPNYLQ